MPTPPSPHLHHRSQSTPPSLLHTVPNQHHQAPSISCRRLQSVKPDPLRTAVAHSRPYTGVKPLPWRLQLVHLHLKDTTRPRPPCAAALSQLVHCNPPTSSAVRVTLTDQIRFVLNLITCTMDLFEDILSAAPAASARPSGKFMPKAKSKQLPRKEISASEHAKPSKDGKNEQVALSSTSAEGISRKECHNAVASTVNISAEESIMPHHCPQVEPLNLEDGTNSEMGNPQQDSVNRDTAPSMITASQVDADWNFTNLAKSACEADSAGFEIGPVTNCIPKTNLNDGTTEPVQAANAVENVLSNVAALSTTCSTTDLVFKSASDDKVAISESNIHSNFNFGREQELESLDFESPPFSNSLCDSGARNAHKFLPKIKPRPRVGTPSASSNVMIDKSAELPTSCPNEVQSFKPSGDGSSGLNQSTNLPLPKTEIIRTTDLPRKFDYMSSSIPFSEDNCSLEAVIPSELDSPSAMLSVIADHNETRDWPSSFGKSAGETAGIFSGLESLDDFVTQAATDVGKPALHSVNEKGIEENLVIPAGNSVKSFGVCDTTQIQGDPKQRTTQDSLTFNNRRSATDPTSEIPVHGELTNAADSPTLADFLHADVAEEKEDGNEREDDGASSSSPRKHKRFSIAGEEDKGGKTSRQLRKQAARKPANNSVNEDVEDDDDTDLPYNPNRDELEENDDEFEVDTSSKKRRASASSKKKSVAKNGKTSQKRKRANDNLEKTTRQLPKKFSHSTQRRKRCVDKALLEIPEDELDPSTLPIKHVVLLAEHKERLAKKEASTSKASSTNHSGGDFRHEAGANNEEEMLGSEDDRDPDDDETRERIPTAPSLYNYQSFMDKAPRAKWSKDDTDLFYKAISQFGADFSMIQQYFPKRTRHQIKLKYKKEERQHPLLLSDALNNRAKDCSHFKLLIERLQQASTKAEQDPGRDASDFMAEEEVEDLTAGTNDEVATQQDTNVKDQYTEVKDQDTGIKDQEDSVAYGPEQSDDSDDELQRWSQYRSNY